MRFQLIHGAGTLRGIGGNPGGPPASVPSRAAAQVAVSLSFLRLWFPTHPRSAAAGRFLPIWAAIALVAWLSAWPGAARSEGLVGVDAKTRAVAQTVYGIVGYTRWPEEPQPVRLCVVGPTEYADELLQGGDNGAARRIEVRRMRLDDAALAGSCDGIYAGRLGDDDWRRLQERMGTQALLSISERRELCRVGCMFCLDVRTEGVGFESNLDSVSRSGVRVNPRVLQLSRRKAGP